MNRKRTNNSDISLKDMENILTNDFAARQYYMTFSLSDLRIELNILEATLGSR